MTGIKTVVLLGTSHRYQYADDPSSAQFTQLINGICDTHSICVIGEEMSAEALQQKQASKSTCEVIANARSLAHKYCDPDNDKRSQLAIRGETEIRLEGFFNNWNKKQIEAAVRASHQIRETYWLQQLVALDLWPALFVCGANHVSEFARLLTSHGMNVHIANADWAP
jgi:hypothetical protein